MERRLGAGGAGAAYEYSASNFVRAHTAAADASTDENVVRIKNTLAVCPTTRVGAMMSQSASCIKLLLPCGRDLRRGGSSAFSDKGENHEKSCGLMD